MRDRLLLAAALVLFGVAAAITRDRPVTDEERTKLGAAVSTEGCEAGS